MTDKMRQEFEAWYIDEGYGGRRPTRHLEGYAAPNVNDMWLSWKASRASLCVELPKQWFDECLGCDLMEVNHVADALDAAGVRYK